MAAKKKTSKKPAKSKKPARKKTSPKKASRPSKPRKPVGKKKPAATKVAARKTAAKTASPAKPAKTQRTRSSAVPYSPESRTSRSGEMSGDLQGLSHREAADSESVDELLEEGNAFEAGVVSGVENADDSEESEVHTHEVPEDDVPKEYLEED